MAENEGVTEVQETGRAPEPKAPEADLEHWKSMSRKNERDAKSAAKERDEANAKLAEVQAQLASLEEAKAYEDAVHEVADEMDLPEKIVRSLKGKTVEELKVSAEILKSNYNAYPLASSFAKSEPQSKTTAQQFAAVVEGLI